jgi:transcriptional regulator with XRE-family HTH domain
MKVDIGYKIKEVFESRNVKLTDFAEELGTVRQNVYRIFKKSDLDTALLKRISEVLDHNFFQYYIETDGTSYSKEAIEALILENSAYKQELELARKEITYLRRIIKLMEEKADIIHQIER